MKKEEKIKNLFTKYLEITFNETYKKIGEDIKVNAKGNDFDYLLRSTSGKTIALEITSVTKSSLSESPSKIPLFETFFRELLDEDALPPIIFTILDPKDSVIEGKLPLSNNKIKSILRRSSEKLKDEISEVIQRLSLYEKHNINLAGGIHFSIERGCGEQGLQFNPYLSHISIIDFDSDRYEYSEEYKVYKQLKEIWLKKNDSLDYCADRRVLLIADFREKVGTDRVLKYATEKYIKQFPSNSPNIDEIFICYWNYEEQEVIFEKVFL